MCLNLHDDDDNVDDDEHDYDYDGNDGAGEDDMLCSRWYELSDACFMLDIA